MTIKVLGYTYLVHTDKTQNEIGSMGRCGVSTQVIQIASDLNEEAAISTVLHEIIEAINFHLKIDLNEQQISSLEAGLYAVFVDNGVELGPLWRRVVDSP